MSSKQVLIVIALVTVCAWSAVMALLGQTAAVAALVPSLGLLVQQIGQAMSSGDAKPPAAADDTGKDAR